MILSATEATDFFALLGALDTFANRRLGIVPGPDDPERMATADMSQRHAIRSKTWSTPALIDDFIRDNPFDLPEHQLADARGFRHAVRGRFFVERILKKHAIFVSTSESSSRVFAVEGLTERIDELLSRTSPLGVAALLDAVILPYRGRLVWDGLSNVLPMRFGPGIRASFRTAYARAKDRGEVILAIGEPSRAPVLPRTKARDWKQAVGHIVAAAHALGKTDTALQTAAFALLKQSASLASAAIAGDREALIDAAKKARRALDKVSRALEQ
jgi:hypothetical protein